MGVVYQARQRWRRRWDRVPNALKAIEEVVELMLAVLTAMLAAWCARLIAVFAPHLIEWDPPQDGRFADWAIFQSWEARFIADMVRMYAHVGALQRRRGAWDTITTAAGIPFTVAG